jgi:hypothetical protein
MNWFMWTSQAAFNSWHETVITGLNLPRVGLNASSGVPAVDAQWTVRYTDVLEVGEGDWRAFVEEHVALAYPVGLGVVCDPPPQPELEF